MTLIQMGVNGATSEGELSRGECGCGGELSRG